MKNNFLTFKSKPKPTLAKLAWVGCVLITSCSKPTNSTATPQEALAMKQAIGQWFSDVNKIYTEPYQEDFQITSAFRVMSPSTLGELAAEVRVYHEVTVSRSIETEFQIEPHPTSTHAFVAGINYLTKKYEDNSTELDGTGGAYEFSFKKEANGQYTVIGVNKTDYNANIVHKFDGVEIIQPKESFLAAIAPEEPISAQAVGGYSGYNAATYARNYAYSPNVAYNNYQTASGDGGDCTNFVSQALLAGGWVQTGIALNNINDVTGSWFYKKDTPGFLGIGTKENSSKAWRLVLGWQQFANAQPTRVQKVASIDQLTYGDVIQVDWKNDGILDHTIIVSGINAKGERLIASHSRPHQVTPFSEYKKLAQNQNLGFSQRYVFYRIVGAQ